MDHIGVVSLEAGPDDAFYQFERDERDEHAGRDFTGLCGIEFICEIFHGTSPWFEVHDVFCPAGGSCRDRRGKTVRSVL
jgi:hypothetical protein